MIWRIFAQCSTSPLFQRSKRKSSSQLFSHLSTNQLFNPFQSAYRPGHSTETALSKDTNHLLRSLDHGNVSVLTLLNLSAAFDTVDHTVLPQRLEHVFGMHDTTFHWFSSYLTNRTQTVTVNNCSSAPVTISCGVPQGSVLGPVLSILYTAPLSDVMDSHSVLHHSFADDTQLQKSAPPQQVQATVRPWR